MTKESIIRKNEREGLEIQELSRNILTSEGYQIIPLIENHRFVNKDLHKKLEDPLDTAKRVKIVGEWGKDMLFGFSYIDHLCKKGDYYFVCDVKYKKYKDDKYLNKVYATKNEVYQYDRLSKTTDFKIIILLVLNKDNFLFYRFYDWNDFKYNLELQLEPNDPTTIGITLKEKINLKTFKPVKI